jgi:hypothetical protein
MTPPTGSPAPTVAIHPDVERGLTCFTGPDAVSALRARTALRQIFGTPGGGRGKRAA